MFFVERRITQTFAIIVGKKEESMFDPNEAFENENNENENEYNPMDDDFVFDDEFIDGYIIGQSMRFALDGFKAFLQSLGAFNSIQEEEFDWYETFKDNEQDNIKPKHLIIDTKNPHLVEYAQMLISLPEDDEKVMEIWQNVNLEDNVLEFSKILDAFGYFKNKLKTIDTIEDLLKEFNDE